MQHPESENIRRRRTKALRQRGFMLVESLVAVVIVGTGILASVAAVSTSSVATSRARVRTTAAWVATSQVELIKSSAFGTEPDAYPTVTPPAGYSIQYTIIPFPNAENPDPFIQDVSIQVFRGSDLITTVEMVKLNQ